MRFLEGSFLEWSRCRITDSERRSPNWPLSSHGNAHPHRHPPFSILSACSPHLEYLSASTDSFYYLLLSVWLCYSSAK